MPCYNPLKAYYSKTVNPSGRRSLVFKRELSHSGVPLQVPCGQCIGCRLQRSAQWATRAMHEKRLHRDSAFLTLTYRDEALTKTKDGATLVLRDLQLFMKRLRLERPLGLRFLACGEYGELTKRPHYHVLLLNTSFPDMKYHKMSGQKKLYASAELDSTWKHGDCLIGEVEFESCAYVAGYVVKKVTGERAAAHYGDRLPEFATMSRNPGLGKGYYLKYRDEVYKHDSVVIRGHEVSVPKYYDTLHQHVDPDRLEVLKRERRHRAMLHKADQTRERLRVRERYQELKRETFNKRKLS